MLYWTIKFPENLFDLQIIDLFVNTLFLVLLSSVELPDFTLISLPFLLYISIELFKISISLLIVSIIAFGLVILKILS